MVSNFLGGAAWGFVTTARLWLGTWQTVEVVGDFHGIRHEIADIDVRHPGISLNQRRDRHTVRVLTGRHIPIGHHILLFSLLFSR